MARSITIEQEYYSPEWEAIAPVRGTIIKPVAAKKNQETSTSVEVSASTDSLKGVESAIARTFGDNHIMYWVAVNESNLDPSAKNPRSSASGVFQITKGTFEGCAGSVFDTESNIACAKKIYDARGLQPWEASKYHGFDGGWGKHLADSNR